MGGVAIYFSNKDKPVAPGGIVDLGIEMRAPVKPGDYVAHWTMISDQGKTFGGDLTVFIKVVK
jgi:methionine-rich copper-binding protein CopC